MKKKLFEFSDLEIWQEGNDFFAVYDAGAHQVVIRKDRISEKEAMLGCESNDSAQKMLFALQERLIKAGVKPYISNID